MGCLDIWDEKIRNSGAVVTLRVRDIKHYENDTLVEGTGTVTYLGDWVNLVSGYGPGICCKFSNITYL